MNIRFQLFPYLLCLATIVPMFAQEVRVLDDSFNANQEVNQREILSGWFQNYVYNPINSVTIQTDGKIVAGGIIPSITGEYRSLVRLNEDGTRDPGFSTGSLLARVSSHAATAQGEIVVQAMLDDRSDAVSKFGPNGQLLWQRKILGGQDYHIRTPIIPLGDGSVLVGGFFTNIANVERKYLALLDTDGNLQGRFNLDINGPITAAALQEDGKVVIGGHFTRIGGVERQRLARLTVNGELDPAFDPRSVFSAEVLAIVLQPDKKIIASGKFNKGNGSIADRIVRLHEDGKVDNSFNAALNETAWRILLDREGRIVLAGDFQKVNGVTRNKVARIVENGTLDASFDPAEGPNGRVADMAIDQNGKYVIAGYFTKVAKRTRNGIARLLPSSTGATVDFTEELFQAGEQYKEAHVQLKRIGEVDREVIANVWVDVQTEPHLQEFPAQTFQIRFAPGEKEKSVTIPFPDDGLVEPDEMVEIKAQVQGENFAKTAAIKILDDEVPVMSEGTIPGLNAHDWFKVMATREGKVAVAGDIYPEGELDTYFSGVRVFNLDGSTNDFQVATFEPYDSNMFRALAWTPDGKLVVSGFFTSANGLPVNNIARLLPNGTVDTSFKVSGSPFGTFVVQSDGKILMQTGPITGSGYAGITRFNLDGSEDNTFESRVPGGAIYKMSLQSDGKILVAESSSGLQRYETNGQMDSTFKPVPEVEDFIVLPDDKLLIKGPFQNVEGHYRPGLARLDKDGKLDRNFVPEIGFLAGRMVLRSDGKLFVRQEFTRQWVLIDEDGSLNREFKLIPGWENFGEAMDPMVALDGGKTLLRKFQVVPAFNSQLSSVVAENNPVILAETEETQWVKIMRIGNVERHELLDLFSRVIKGESSNDYISAMSISFTPMQRETQIPFLQTNDDLVEEDEVFEEIIGSKDVPNFVPGSYRLIILDKNGRPGSADYITPLSLRTNSSRIFDGVNGWFVITSTTDEAITLYHPETGQDLNFQLRTEGSRLIQVALGLEDGVLVGGPFFGTTDNPVTGIVRFKMDGTLDSSFESPALPVFPYNLLREPSGTFLVGGTTSRDDFTTTIVRLNPNGSIADRFLLPFGARHGPLLAPNKLLYTIDGTLRVLDLSTKDDESAFGPVETFRLGGGRGLISEMAVRGNDVFIAGNFDSVNGVPMSGFAKLDKEGNVDSNYNPVIGFGLIDTFEVDDQGRAIIFGNFNSVDGIERQGAVRLNADGTVDLGFDVGYSLQVSIYEPWIDSATMMPDGELFIMAHHPVVANPYRVARISGDLPFRLELKHGWTGMVDLRMNTKPQAEYRIESSMDLSTWQDVVTTNATRFQLTVPLPASGANRFFRVEEK